MPFRHQIVSGDGTVVIPQIQSPDYSATLPPNHVSVTGWRLNASPSYVAAKTVYTESVVIGSPKWGVQNLDIARAVTLLGDNPPQHVNVPALNPLTTTYQICGFITGVTRKSVNSEGGIREKWYVRLATLFLPIIAAPTGDAHGAIRIVEYNSGGGLIASTDLNVKILAGARGGSSRFTQMGEWLIGDPKTTSIVDDNPTDFILNANTVSFDVNCIVKSSVAGEYRIAAPSDLTVQPHVTVGYTS